MTQCFHSPPLRTHGLARGYPSAVPAADTHTLIPFQDGLGGQVRDVFGAPLQRLDINPWGVETLQ